MMRVGFDIWHHLDLIDVLVKDPNATVLRPAWYKVWAFFFRGFGIEDIFIRARVIHVAQTLTTAVLIFLSARLIFSAVIKAPDTGSKAEHHLNVQYLSIFSVFIWLTINATFSIYQHHVWLMWYSVNYQITLPLHLLFCGLLVHSIEMSSSPRSLLPKVVCMLAIMALVLLFHAAEFMYSIWVLAITAIVYWRKWLLPKNAKWLILGLCLLAAIVLVANQLYSDRLPELLVLFMHGQFADIVLKIQNYGLEQVNGLNRRSSGWNELLSLSILCLPILLMVAWFQKGQLRFRALVWVVAVSLMALVPLFQWSSGLAAMTSYPAIVSRYYFSSTVFLILPFTAYLLLLPSERSIKVLPLSAIIIVVLGLTYAYSSHQPLPGNYSKNVNSLLSAWHKKEVGLDYSQADLEQLQTQVLTAEARYGRENVVFFARPDLAYLIKYVHKRSSIYFDRRSPLTLKGFYEYAEKIRKIPVLIDGTNIPPSPEVMSFHFMSQVEPR